MEACVWSHRPQASLIDGNFRLLVREAGWRKRNPPCQRRSSTRGCGDNQDVDGNMQTEESDGLRAVCHQHEIDQLNGLFWINRLSRLKRERLIKRFEKVSRRP
jgi:hypothetical protein